MKWAEVDVGKFFFLLQLIDRNIDGHSNKDVCRFAIGIIFQSNNVRVKQSS